MRPAPLLLATLAAALSPLGLHAAVCESPKSKNMRFWEPAPWLFIRAAEPRTVADAIIGNTTGARNQGYDGSYSRFQDSPSWPTPENPATDQDNDVGTCSRNSFDRLARGTGILALDAHGYSGGMVAVMVKSRSRAERWIAAGSDNADMAANRHIETNTWWVDVDSAWFARNWSTSLNNQRALVVVSTCFSANPGSGAGTAQSMTAAIGGRSGIGWSGTCPNIAGIGMVNSLFEYLNGTWPTASDKRKLGDAVDTFQGSLHLEGSRDTTLCPSVENSNGFTAPDSPVYPVLDVSEEERSGTGHITFDTKLDTSAPLSASQVDGGPPSALKYKVTEGSVTLSNFRWNGPNRIDFDYNGYGKFTVEMHAIADHLRPRGAVQKLDGGGFDNEGKAQNGDDYVWSFHSSEYP